MIGTILKVLGAVLGLNGSGSMANTVGGFANHLVSVPVLIWLLTHADRTVSFETSYGFLALVVAVAYLVLEVLRRSRPAGGG